MRRRGSSSARGSGRRTRPRVHERPLRTYVRARLYRAEMPSEGAPTVPIMRSFKRALLGYRRREVDAAMEDREAQIADLKGKAADAIEQWRETAGRADQAEAEAADLSGMVIEREREIRVMGERLQEANERHER